jgi:hypothetical protein
VIPSSVEVITKSAFLGCTALIEVIFELGSSLKEIDGFSGCTSLYRFAIPSSVELIPSEAFSGCTALTEVIFEKGSRLKRFAGFRRCISLCRFVVPSSVTVIPSEAFLDCASLAEVIFETPSQCTTIYGFRGCESLRRISFPPSLQIACDLPYLAAFPRCSSLRCIEFAEGSNLQDHHGFHLRRLFITYESEHLKSARRRFQM